jgi:hypothetical protein
MLVDEIITPEMWEKTFQKKMSSFCKKSPILIRMSTRIQDGSKGVLLTHVNSEKNYFFPFNYDMNVKDFIADAKRILVANHYPRLVQTIYENHKKTNEELAQELENGEKVDSLTQYCVKKTGERMYRIDKVLPWKNIAIIVLEQSSVPGDNVGTVLKYSYQKSLVLYLKNYRTGVFKNIDEASDDFFNNSLLVSEITVNPNNKED